VFDLVPPPSIGRARKHRIVQLIENILLFLRIFILYAFREIELLSWNELVNYVDHLLWIEGGRESYKSLIEQGREYKWIQKLHESLIEQGRKYKSYSKKKINK